MKHDGTSHDGTLHEIAQRLGSRAAEQLDVEATARRVVAELRENPVRHRTWIEVHLLRIAAAVVILVGGGLAVRQILPMREVGGSGHSSHLVSDDLNDLTTDELQDVLDNFDEMVGVNTVVPDSSDLRELDAQQLRTMLRSLEG